MKLRSKLLLSATCLLTISVAATATSAYAWFTANRQAFVSVTNMSVKSGVDKVFIDSSNTEMTQDPNKQAVSGDATYVGTDVSGTGLNLYKPSFKEHNKTSQLQSVVNSIADVTENAASGVNNKNAFYNEINLKFTHENNDVTTAIYLSHLSTITKAADNTATGIAGTYRVAFLNKEKTSLLAYYAPNDEVAPKDGVGGLSQHISSTSYREGEITKTSGALSKFVSATNTTNLSLNANQLLGKTFKDVTDADGKSDSDTGIGYLGTIDNTKGLEIVVRIWCEGMDADCINTNIDNNNSMVNVNLKFNGVTHTA